MNNKMKRVCYLLVVIFSFCNCNAVNNINDYRTRFDSYFSEIDGFYNWASDANYFSKSEFLNKLYLDNNECQFFDFLITNTNATNAFIEFWNDKELKTAIQIAKLLRDSYCSHISNIDDRSHRLDIMVSLFEYPSDND